MRRLFVLILFVVCTALAASAQTRLKLEVQGDHFVLDGKPFQIISGEMHYARVPRAYWRERFKMARAMGLNAITTYVFWDLHEPRPGVFDFTGQLDLAEYIREAQQEGLYVILRPGPYVCSEWDLGGLPSWLLADPQMLLRSAESSFMQPAARYLKEVGKQVGDLQSTRGGPIIAVQVENEYGSFDNDKEYMSKVRDAIVQAGLGEVLLYTADGPGQLPDGTLPDLAAVVNFGPGEAPQAFATLAKFRPGQPIMAGEWWAGWFDHWGVKHHVTDAEKEANELAWILDHGYSVSIYMWHGGSSWGFMNGANAGREGYRPDVSSYDYDAALDESGRPTKKYQLFRDVISKHTGAKLPDVPAAKPAVALPPIALRESASLFDNLQIATRCPGDAPKSMEECGQSYGFILYRREQPVPGSGSLNLGKLRDYATVFINGERQATFDRRTSDTASLPIVTSNNRIDVLIENLGRINFGKELRNERKGLVSPVQLAGKRLSGWTIYSLPMDDLSRLQWKKPGKYVGPGFRRGTFTLKETADTFLDMRGWTKGLVWINGHPLGRFWNIGPQQTLYLPAPWLKVGSNEIVVFDMNGGRDSLTTVAAPILDDVKQ